MPKTDRVKNPRFQGRAWAALKRFHAIARKLGVADPMARLYPAGTWVSKVDGLIFHQVCDCRYIVAKAIKELRRLTRERSS